MMEKKWIALIITVIIAAALIGLFSPKECGGGGWGTTTECTCYGFKQATNMMDGSMVKGYGICLACISTFEPT